MEERNKFQFDTYPDPSTVNRCPPDILHSIPETTTHTPAGTFLKVGLLRLYLCPVLYHAGTMNFSLQSFLSVPKTPFDLWSLSSVFSGESEEEEEETRTGKS